MDLILCFLGCAVLCLTALLLTAHSFGSALLISFGVFILLHAVCLIFFALIGMTVPNNRPLAKQNRLCMTGCCAMAGTLNWYAGIRPVITGLEKIPTDSRFVYVCNHRSMYDPLIVMDKLRKYNIAFISKPSNMKLPLIGRPAYAAGFLAIDRENNREALKTILTAADYLKRDLCSIGIYPEGTRSRTGDMLPFHAGSFKTAQKASVPVVVASIRGTEKVRHVKLFSTTKVYLNILECIPADTVKEMRTDELAAYVQELIRSDLATGESEG